MSFFSSCLIAVFLLIGWAGQSLAVDSALRIAVLKVGTVNWELNTISHYRLDEKNGFKLVVQGMAGVAATRIAFQGGQADVMVADWIWVARQRAAGKPYTFIPYSRAVGGLLVPADSPVEALSGLAGKTIGIAGGPVDKSWLILRAYAEKFDGFDLAGKTSQVFGAPPLIFKNALSAKTDGTINFWHFNAMLKARGMRELISVEEAATALGLDPRTPLLGYVVRDDLIEQQQEIVAGFVRASRQAKALLASDDKAWNRLRPIMRAKSDSDFAALIAGFRAGNPGTGPVNREAAEQMLALMAKFGGRALVGDAATLPEGVFAKLPH